MQRGKSTHSFSRDLQQTISEMKAEGYRRALGEAHNPTSLSVIDRMIRSDYQLTRGDRLQILAEVQTATSSFDLTGEDVKARR